MVVEVCSTDFTDFVNGPILQISAIATFVSAMIVVFSYYIGQIISNPKVSVWAKSEVVQLLVSAASVIFILISVNTFCAIDMSDVASIFEISGVPSGTDVYTGAQNYLNDTLTFTHDGLVVVRYHLQAYTILSHLSAFSCDMKTGTIGWGCLFSYSGTSGQPLGAYSSSMGALNLFFNSSLVAYITTLNFLFILLIIFKGFVLFLLPFGIFVRSLPYLRSLGSLLIAVALSFMIVYPLILSIFGLMSGVLLDAPPGLASYMNEKKFPNNGGAMGAAQSLGGSIAGAWIYEEIYFPSGSNVPGAIAFAAYAFIAGVFFPTAALIATIATINYLARLYGEEIDLSRIIQMV
jgi:hypothetical protein